MKGKRWATLSETHKITLSPGVLQKQPSLSIFPAIRWLNTKHMPLSGYCHLFLFSFSPLFASVMLVVEGFFGSSQQEV